MPEKVNGLPNVARPVAGSQQQGHEFTPPGRALVDLRQETLEKLRNATPLLVSMGDDDDKRIWELLTSYATLTNEDEVAKRWEQLFTKFFPENVDIDTMWTFTWSDASSIYYAKDGIGEKSRRARARIRRIMVRPLRDVLYHIEFHREDLNDRHQLILPNFTKKQHPREEEVLDASAFIPDPPIEIVVFGHDRATLSFRVGSASGFLETGSTDVVENFYRQMWKFIAAKGRRIQSKASLWSWLLDLDLLQPRIGQECLRSLDEIWKVVEFQWDHVAQLYPRVRESNLPFLTQYFEGERSALLEAVDKIGPGADATYIDLGCGPRELLEAVASHLCGGADGARGAPLPETRTNSLTKDGDLGAPQRPPFQMIGVDSSPLMLRAARTAWQEVGSRVDAPCAFLRADLRRLPSYIQGGVPMLGDGWDAKEFDALNKERLRNRPRFAWITNVFPNIRTQSYTSLLRSVARALAPGDLLFISTYDGATFGSHAENLYEFTGEIGITGKFSRANLDIDRRIYRNPDTRFFSRWPLKTELSSAVRQANLVEARPERDSRVTVCPSSLGFHRPHDSGDIHGVCNQPCQGPREIQAST